MNLIQAHPVPNPFITTLRCFPLLQPINY